MLAFVDECLPGLSSRPRRNLVRASLPFLEHLARLKLLKKLFFLFSVLLNSFLYPINNL